MNVLCVLKEKVISERKMNYIIREIEEKDNKAVEKVIRACLIEYGGNHEGTAWADPDLGRFSEIYNSEGNKYWVIEDENGKVVLGQNITNITEFMVKYKWRQPVCFT